MDQLQAETWSAPTGDLSLSYRLTEDATVYGKYSRGWKPGGFNGAVVVGGDICDVDDCPLTEPIEAETVDGWEVGVKSYWFDRRLMFNAALFFQKYEDLQVFVLENSNLTGTPLAKLINANDAEIYGLEAEINARPIPGLDIRTQFGWLESKYLDFTRTFFRQARRRDVRQCLTDRLTRVPQLATNRPDAQPLNQTFTSNQFVMVHCQHPYRPFD